MGFERRVYKLVWPEGSFFAGLEVRMRPMPTETVGEIGLLHAKAEHGSDEDRIALLPAMAGIVQQSIVSWNLTDGGEPVPCTNVGAEGMEMVMAIIQAWQQAANEVSAPLLPGSRDGEPSPEDSMPMEIPSASHSS